MHEGWLSGAHGAQRTQKAGERGYVWCPSRQMQNLAKSVSSVGGGAALGAVQRWLRARASVNVVV